MDNCPPSPSFFIYSPSSSPKLIHSPLPSLAPTYTAPSPFSFYFIISLLFSHSKVSIFLLVPLTIKFSSFKLSPISNYSFPPPPSPPFPNSKYVYEPLYSLKSFSPYLLLGSVPSNPTSLIPSSLVPRHQFIYPQGK